ncbi:MAG: GNAT family N-acetyltransferase [Bacteroidales bacterium]
MKYDQIKLRAPEPEDLAILYRWENDPSVWQISNILAPFSKYTLKRYIEKSHRSIFEAGQLRFMIEIAGKGSTIGTIDLFDFDAFHLRAGVGILIAEREERRKGYAGMALKGILNYCFEHLMLHQVYCNITEDNTASVNLFTKTGFTEIGYKKDWIKTKDGFKGEIMYQIINPSG